MTRIPRLLAKVLLTILVMTVVVPAGADEIVLAKRKIRGVIVKREGGKAFINPYNSRNERMTYGVETVDESSVRRVIPDPTPEWRYLEALLETIPPTEEGDAEAHLKMAGIAAELGLDEPLRHHQGEALVLGASAAQVEESFSEAEAKRHRAADPRSNAELRADLDAAEKLEKVSERKAALSRIEHDHGYQVSFEHFERRRRSRLQATGRQNDRLLRLRSKTEKGVYTLFVPKNYDPERSWPLVLGLHGGGPDGKDGKDVVGSGRSAMNFYARGAARHGYIVACPSAVRAPWRARENAPFVEAVLDEVAMLYNVDLNRVYLTGHSMGGFGAWYFGTKEPWRYAVVAPMSGGGFRGLGPFEKTHTPVYLHHGADDPVVGCGNSRQAAEAMRKAEHDFIYTEIPDSGHGFPSDVNAEMWRMFHVRRLAATPKRTQKGRFGIALAQESSFDLPWTKDETTYFGEPGEGLPEDRKSLLARLRLGGAAALEAVELLLATEEPKSLIAPVGKLVASPRNGLDVRRAACRLLGETKLVDAAKPLMKALKKPDPDLVPALAQALMQLGEPKSVKRLARALGPLGKDFEGRASGKQMRYSDWARCLGAHEAVARCLAALGPEPAAESLVRSARLLLLEDWQVPKSDRAGVDPARPLGRCAAAFVVALGGCENGEADEVRRKIIEKHGQLPEMKAEAKE